MKTKGATYKAPLDVNPADPDRAAYMDTDGGREARWWEERRKNSPNLHAVIDAAQKRLTEETLGSHQRDVLETVMVGLSHFQRNRYEISESDRDEQLRIIENL